MILRTLLVAAGLFGLYNVVLLAPAVQRQFSTTQGQFQTNLVKAQEYLVAPASPPVIIVGSSLAALLPAPVLGDDIFNLAFAGGGPASGLALVARHPAPPAVLAIEINQVLRGADEPLIDDACDPVLLPLRRQMPALREKFEPSNLVAGNVGGRVLHRLNRLMRRVLGPSRAPAETVAAATVADPKADPKTDAAAGTLTPAETTSPTPAVPSELFLRLLADQQRSYAVAPPATELTHALDQLATAVNALEARGVRVVFFEMPVDASLQTLPRTTDIRRAALARFPEARYRWVRPPDGPYQTNDGIHLHQREAKRFAEILRSELAAARAAPQLAHR